jgi:hypothetical protein
MGAGGLCPAASGAGLCGGAEDGGYAIDRIEFSGGDTHHQVVGLRWFRRSSQGRVRQPTRVLSRDGVLRRLQLRVQVKALFECLGRFRGGRETGEGVE